MRKYKRSKDCPKNLEEIIELMNCLNEESLEFEQGLREDLDKGRSINLGILKRKLGEKIFNYIGGEFAKEFYFGKLENLVKAKKIFHLLGELNKKIIAKEFSNKEFKEFTELELFHLQFELIRISRHKFSSKLKLTGEGYLKPEQNELLEIFENTDISFRRIHICEFCENIYWAKRTDSLTCSAICARMRGQRRFRSQNKNFINEQRRINYRYKKTQLNNQR